MKKKIWRRIVWSEKGRRRGDDEIKKEGRGRKEKKWQYEMGGGVEGIRKEKT